MYQLFQDVCHYLESINHHYKVVNEDKIIAGKGTLKGLEFTFSPDECYVRANKHLEIYFDYYRTSVDSLISTLYKHQVIDQQLLERFKPEKTLLAAG